MIAGDATKTSYRHMLFSEKISLELVEDNLSSAARVSTEVGQTEIETEKESMIETKAKKEAHKKKPKTEEEADKEAQ